MNCTTVITTIVRLYCIQFPRSKIVRLYVVTFLYLWYLAQPWWEWAGLGSNQLSQPIAQPWTEGVWRTCEKKSKKQKLIANTEKLSAVELLEKYRNHFKKDEDIEMENAADALDIKNEAVQITHPSFRALMQATGGFRPGEFTIVGSWNVSSGFVTRVQSSFEFELWLKGRWF